MVHQRFSTNTFPSWQLAHPYRYLCHNGEINTIRGNEAWMRARSPILSSPVWGDDMAKLLPVVQPGGSDSAMLDNVVELLSLSGRSLPHVMTMLIPEAWNADTTMSPDKRAFYEYHASLMEPWDGPAAVAFTDGRVVGATLDRNGLRPARYCVTADDLVVMASESGVLPVRPEDVLFKGRLQPGKMLLVDTVQRRIVPDEEIKQGLWERQPYAKWIEEQQIRLDSLPMPRRWHTAEHETILAAPAVLRLHARKTRRRSSCRWRSAARSRSDRWASTRRWRACPTGRSRCSTTSSSSSRRSPTRRSIRSARSW